MLSLIKFSPLKFETHIVALLFAALTLWLSAYMIGSRPLSYHATSGLVGLVCWYVFKICDGVSFDDRPSASATLVGVAIAALLLWFHFL